ncbi:MAG: MFS transporter [Nitrospirota bacterium]
MPLSKKTAFSDLFTRDFSILFLAHFFFASAVWPYVVFPAHLLALGADPFFLGIFAAGASLSSIIIRPFVGHQIDHKGRRIYLLIGGIIFLATHFFYLLPNHLGAGLFAVRLLHGLGTGILMATFFTLGADLSPPDRRVSGIAIFGISGQLSGAMSIILAEKIVEIWGFPYFFIFCAALSLISLILSCFIRETVNEKPDFPLERLWKRAFSPSLRIPFLTTFLFSLGITSYVVFLKPYTKTLGLPHVSYFFLAYTLSAITVRLIGLDYCDRYGPKAVLYPALSSLVLGILLIIILPSTFGLIVSGIFCGLGHGWVFPALSSIVISRGGESHRGGFMTLYTLVFDLGALLGSPLLGLLVRGVSYTAIYIAAAALVLLGVISLHFFDGESSTT